MNSMTTKEDFFRLADWKVARKKRLCFCCGVKTEKRGQIHCDTCHGRYIAFVLIPEGEITPPIDLSLFEKKDIEGENPIE